MTDQPSARREKQSERRRKTAKFAEGYSWETRASFYADKFHGRQTANGETYDMNGISVAHKTLSFGTMLEVENLNNHRKVIVRVNDRGPFVRGRDIDLSLGAAKQLGMVQDGVVDVRITIMKLGE